MPAPQGRIQRLFGAVTQAGRVLTGRQIAGRGLTVFPDDVFLVSYPRSGNTWTRFLLGNLIYQDEPVTFSNVESRIPEIYFNRDRFLRQLQRPRMLKSHECFQPHYPRVIYIVRDPRDVAISFYHHNVKARNISDDYPMASFVPRFIAGDFDRKFGSWRDNVRSWTELRGDDPNFLMLRYEEMKDDTAAALRRIVAFLERGSFRKIDSSPEALQRAIELSSPERMRALEKQETAGWVLTKGTRSDKPFVRSAISGGWKTQLTPESVAAIESAWGQLMQRFGYELISEPTSVPAAASVSGSAFVTEDTPRTFKTACKDLLREVIPSFFLQQRGIVRRLGPGAGGIYRGLRVRDMLGIRSANQRIVPSSARSFVFVCFGNIMRSAMAEFLMRQTLSKAGIEQQVQIRSAGLHATAGREAHAWAQEAAADLGISLSDHRAKLLTPEMVEQADCILAMDFQNKAELLTLYPEAEEKIYMLSAYAEGPWQYREIPDPYLGDLETTRVCGRQLRTCIQNLIASTLLASASRKEQPVAHR